MPMKLKHFLGLNPLLQSAEGCVVAVGLLALVLVLGLEVRGVGLHAFLLVVELFEGGVQVLLDDFQLGLA